MRIDVVGGTLGRTSPNRNCGEIVVVVVVAGVKMFVDDIGRVVLKNILVVVVAATDRGALSDGGRLWNSGFIEGLGGCDRTGGSIAGRRGAEINDVVLSKSNGILPTKDP